MRGMIRASLLALLLVCVCAPRPGGAGRESGPSANGDFRFTMDDGVTRHLEFDARGHKDGSAKGQMTFSAQGELPDQDVDGAGVGALPPGVFMKADFDCLTVQGSRAVMGGLVSQTNVDGYVGRRVLLVVEDGGEGVEAPPDKLTWGVYLNAARNWTPRDAERDPNETEPDNWTATDFERPDDAGIPARRDETVRCETFPASSYSFVDVRHGGGNIQVRP